MAKSEVVREAIMGFYDRLGRSSDSERSELLRIFDEVFLEFAPRSAAAVNEELDTARQARKAGGRRTRSDQR